MKFMLLDNLGYVLKRYKFFIFFSILLLVIIVLTLPYNDFTKNALLYKATLTNVDFKNGFYVEWIYYFYYFSFYLMITITLYQRELLYHLDLVLLRYSIQKWFFQKIVILLTTFVLIKIVQYGVILFLLICHHVSYPIQDVLSLFFTDVFYFCFWQIAFVFGYSLAMIYPKVKWLLCLILLFFLWIFPKNIVYFQTLKWCLLLVLVISCIYLILRKIFLKKYRKMIQNLEVLK